MHACRSTLEDPTQLVLKAYGDGYDEVAALHDAKAPADEIARATRAAHEPYCAKYEALSSRLVELGKPYAEKHGIKVNWGTP